MNPKFHLDNLAVPATLAILAFASTPALAGTMSASPEAPPVNGLDIANYAASNGTEKWWAENTTGAGGVKGQTFTTGGIPVLLKAITYQTSTNSPDGEKTYVVRVGSTSGTALSQIHTETFTQDFPLYAGQYMTWTFASPVLLSANTTYGIDVGMTASTAGWSGNLIYLYRSANTYPDGVRYSCGTSGVGTDTLNLASNSDFIFHLDLQHPLNPSPDIGAEVPAGALTLSWTNMTPTTGTDVWVDVWFGTDPGALTKVADKQQNLTSFLVNLPGADTYYWRIDSYLDGAPTGTPVQSTLFNFLVFDSDGDGFPDDYEELHTDPPSGTALNREDDRDMDSSTNWNEYQNGTNPSLPDTDDDGLLDGNGITVTSADPRYTAWVTDGILFTDNGGDRTFRGELALGTNPLKQDTDNDGLLDGVETNTGVWVSATNTGTNPINPDTDGDGLKDGVETKTGTFVSTSDTGTNPHLADTDNDGAGDWYEVAASYTNPNSAASKPNIPYPLPTYDGAPGVSNKPVKVYIMSGQSNMLGYGQVTGSGPGTLNTMVNQENKFPHLASGGGWVTRNDVHIHSIVDNNSLSKKLLSPTWKGDKYGPEFGFGTVMGWYHNEPVLIIKPSIGNRALGWDYRPPDTIGYTSGDRTYPAYGESPENWLTASGSEAPFVWYAGKQYDDYFLDENDMGMRPWVTGIAYPASCSVRHNGFAYISKSAHTSSAEFAPQVDGDGKPVASTYWNVYSVYNTVDILDTFATEYAGPGKPFEGQDFQIAGFVWWQGHRDGGEQGTGTAGPYAVRYEENLVKLINSLRSYYDNRYPGKVIPNAPFVVATCGFSGGNWTSGSSADTIFKAQMAVSDPAKHSQFAGNVASVDTRGYWRSGDPGVSPSTQGYHYNWNAETYLLTGDAAGREMIKLLQNVAPPGDGYATWQSTNGATGQTLDQDHDDDGVRNGIEFFLGGPNGNTSGFTALPGVSNTGSTSSITWTKAAAYTGSYGTDFVVETSDTLNGTWTPEALGVNVAISDNDVTYTFPSPPGARKFARLKVTGP